MSRPRVPRSFPIASLSSSIVAAAAFAHFPVPAAAAPCTFTPANGDWEIVGNRDCGHVPTTTGMQRLADGGNASARVVVDELGRRGVTINVHTPAAGGGAQAN